MPFLPEGRLMEMFRDKVAIVTGGGSGIGEALCEELAHRGSIVVVADIDGERARQVASRIAESGGQARAMAVDVSHEEEVKRLVDGIVLEYRQLDFMFNNAGIAVGGDARDLSSEQWRRVLEVNLFGELYGTLAAYPHMVRQGHGHIVNTASLAGLTPLPASSPYSTSKHAIVGLSLTLRIEAEDLGVRVSVVCPGWVQTNFYQATPVVNARVDHPRIRAKKMDASQAVQALLKGVSRNRAVIVFPRNTRFFWRIYRFYPPLINRSLRRLIRSFRRVRLSS